MPTNPRGLILLVIVGVLGVLTVLGTAFVTLAQMERRASQQRLDATRALLLARSGIEDALARLEAGQDPEADASRYGGEDWNGDRLLDGPETAAEGYRPAHLDTDACPVRYALRPSFFRNLDGAPRLAEVDGRSRGYSGLLTGDLSPEGNTYALKIRSGGLYVNDGDLSSSGEHPGTYDAVLKRILGNLADALDEEDGATGDGPVTRADGQALVTARPQGGWQSLEEIRDLALGGSQNKLDVLVPYLTLQAFVDRKVIRPNAENTMLGATGKNFPTWASYKTAHRSASTGEPRPDLEPRAPVWLGWARHRRPVLIALLGGLKGVHLRRAGAGFLGISESVEIGSTGSPLDETHLVAEALLTCPSDLDTWAQWNAFCDGLSVLSAPPSSWRQDAIQAKKDTLKANFNPNSDLNKFNPNTTLWKRVDKSDLLLYSTEFELAPSCGMEILSEGRCLDPSGRLKARREIRAFRKGPSLLRLTTQREFAGDAGSPRLPGSANFLSQSRGREKTWGHRLDLRPQDPGTWMTGASNGVSLQLYPEPWVDARTGSGLTLNPAEYDGSLQLATLETADDAWYGITATTQDLKLLARFDDGFDLDVADGPERRNLTDGQQVMTSELTCSLLALTPFNTLYPDGCYSERNRTPAYRSQGNANGLHGLFSFWVKPASAGRGTSHPYLRWTNYRGFTGYTYGNAPNQFFLLGLIAQGNWWWSDSPVFQFETGSGDDVNHEYQFPTNDNLLQEHRWHLMTLYYDFEAALCEKTAALIVNDGMGPADLAFNSRYSSFGFNDPAFATDITVPDGQGPHRLGLGGNRGDQPYDGTDNGVDNPSKNGADATLDEFALYDFGNCWDAASGFALNRHHEGRYYRGSEYSGLGYGAVADEAAAYVSAPLPLPAGSRLRRVCWTWYRPSELPGDYPELALLDLDGTGYLGDENRSRSVLATGWNPTRPDWRPGVQGPAPFRLQVVFRRISSLGPDTPILDSPVLDDVTLFYERCDAPLLTAWKDPTP